VAEDIVDRIYEAAALPELWPDLLEALTQRLRAQGTVLFVVRTAGNQAITSPGAAELMKTYFERGYQYVDDRTRRLLARDEAAFLTDFDVFTDEEWAADPIIRDFWRPLGMGYGTATRIAMPTGETVILHAERMTKEGRFDRPTLDAMDRLRPHLARAALMSARLAFERMRGAVTALGMMGLPAAVLDRRGVLYLANDLFNDSVPAVFADLPSGLRLSAEDDDALLQQAIGAATGGTYAAPYSVPFRAREGRPPMIVHLLPVTGAANDVFTRAGAIVIVTPVTAGELPSAQMIQGLFDLTPAEARVARGVGEGATIAGIAATSGLAEATIRNQLREIFGKTGTHRQAELVGLLRGIVPPPRGEAAG
jgi:DNA-binding CsgD family transcriptional regulator